jgi:hypothetical protein
MVESALHFPVCYELLLGFFWFGAGFGSLRWDELLSMVIVELSIFVEHFSRASAFDWFVNVPKRCNDNRMKIGHGESAEKNMIVHCGGS